MPRRKPQAPRRKKSSSQSAGAPRAPARPSKRRASFSSLGPSAPLPRGMKIPQKSCPCLGGIWSPSSRNSDAAGAHDARRGPPKSTLFQAEKRLKIIQCRRPPTQDSDVVGVGARWSVKGVGGLGAGVGALEHLKHIVSS